MGGLRDRPTSAPVNCANEGAMPHPSSRRRPAERHRRRRAAPLRVYFVFANPDGWRRGDLDNGVRFFQRYNGNGVDMNRDWPTIGFRSGRTRRGRSPRRGPSARC